MKQLLLILFLFPCLSHAQFVARFDVDVVTDVSDDTWTMSGKLIDLTGSYTGLDVKVGYKIVQRSVDTLGRFTYDRFIINIITSQTPTDLSVIVASDHDTGIKSAYQRPSTGSWMIGESLELSRQTFMPSFYQHQIDPDMDAGMINLNLEESPLVVKKLLSVSSDTTFDSIIAPGFMLQEIVFKNLTSFPAQISCGTTTTTTNVFGSMAITDSAQTTIPVNKLFSTYYYTDLCFNHTGEGDSWNGSINNIYVLGRKIANRDVLYWILRTGYWDDDGIWIDTKTWID